MPFDLFLFTTDLELVRRADAAGVDGFVVDWENAGKERRQRGADTQINRDTPDDLRRVRGATSRRLICRINGYGAVTAGEVEEAIGGGADELLLPMVTSPAEVEALLRMAAGRCGVGILVETVAAVRGAAELARLPLTRIYVGLNDLAIQRGSASIFEALVDGTLDRARAPVRVPFGFAGVTLPELGHPIPCRVLVGEMARQRAAFTFLRRSFLRDTRGRDLAVEVPRIVEAVRAARRRGPEEVARDREELVASVRAVAWA